MLDGTHIDFENTETTAIKQWFTIPASGIEMTSRQL